MNTTRDPRSARSLRRSTLSALACLGALTALAAGCVARDVDSDSPEELVAEEESALYGNGDYWSMGTNGITEIPVCWTFTGYDNDKQYVQSAVEGQWGAVSSIRFTGWGICGTSTPSDAIRIREGDETPHSQVGTTGSGVSMTLNFHYSNWNSYTSANCECPPIDPECVFHSKSWYDYGCDHCDDNHPFCNGLIGLHEFGHALGFYHEQDRPDNADGSMCNDTVFTRSNGDYLTSDYDTSSIMGYCSEWDHTSPVISSGDVEGVIAAYDVKPNNLTHQVLIYQSAGFSRSVQALYPGSYNASDLEIGNDKLSSLRVPSGWSVKLYADSGYSGSSITVTGDVVDLSALGFDDKTSSIKVTGPSNSFPVVYKGSGYSGASLTLRPGVYNTKDDLTGIGNNAISSISVPSGWSVTLYENEKFGGSSVTYTSSASSLGSFNDETTSIKVVGPSGWNPVVIYKDGSYSGKGQALWPGRYEVDDLTIGKNELTSLTVPSGWTVMLMEHSPYSGQIRRYTSNKSSVSGDSFNDMTSSIVVQGPDS